MTMTNAEMLSPNANFDTAGVSVTCCRFANEFENKRAQKWDGQHSTRPPR
jgi:hypothetical protein